ncbi:MAG: hypothetical protein PVF29_14145 [Desulfobacterales bacterium]|jgi:hypothetical protein
MIVNNIKNGCSGQTGFNCKTFDGRVLLLLLFMVLWPNGVVRAEDPAENRDVKQELKLVEDKEEEELSWLNQQIQPLVGDKVRLNGVVELNYEYLDVRDIDDENSDSSSDFFMSTAELALRVFFNDWSKSKVVVNAEDYGKRGDQGKVRLDEAIVTLKSLRAPVYFIAGKTVMSFGVFEDHLIEGTLAEDLYEIDEWGATIGFNPDFYGLDLSFSVYRDPQIIENLQNEDTHDFRVGRQKEDRFRSYIANLSLAPIEDILTVSTFYNSEPGDGDRNRSIGGAFTLNYWRFTLDTEFITALERENGDNEEENKESARIIGLAFKPLDSLQLATRYEVFSDDTRGDQDEVLDYRIVAGFNYSFLDLIDVFFLTEAALLFEYRYSKFEKEADSEATESQNMYQVQFVFGF